VKKYRYKTVYFNDYSNDNADAAALERHLSNVERGERLVKLIEFHGGLLCVTEIESE
jgi:hypothetical protein